LANCATDKFCEKYSLGLERSRQQDETFILEKEKLQIIIVWTYKIIITKEDDYKDECKDNYYYYRNNYYKDDDYKDVTISRWKIMFHQSKNKKDPDAPKSKTMANMKRQ